MPISFKKGWFYVKIQVNGRRFTPTMFGMQPARWKKEKDAIVGEGKLKELVEKQETIPTGTDLLNLSNKYIDAMEHQVIGKDTLPSKKRLIKYMLQRWGNIDALDIKVWMAQEFLNERAEKRSANNYNAYRKEGSCFFNWLIDQQLLPNNTINVFEKVKKLPHEPKKSDPAIIDNVIKVLEIAKPDQRELLYAYLLTGARKSEILKMVWVDIDFENRTYLLHTRKTGTSLVKTTKHPMSDALYQLLLQRREQKHPELHYVFWHKFYSREDKKYIEDRYRDLNGFATKLCEKAGVTTPFRLHQLRHLATAILKSEGMSIGQLQVFLRHDEQKTTEIYAGHLETSTKVQSDILGDFWTKKMNAVAVNEKG